MKTIEDAVRELKENKVKFTRFLYIDNDGVIRGNIAVGEKATGDLASGHTFSMGMPFFSVLDTMGPETQFGCTGELTALPDLDTLTILPYISDSASVICDFVKKDTMETSEICARSLLKRILKDIPFEVSAAFENEFYVIRREDNAYLPFDKSLCFATGGMNQAHPLISDLVEALEKQNIKVIKYHPEYGPGQHEIAISHAGVLQACDNQVIFRETARGVAANHDLIISFMPKPFENLAGSGSHAHLSFWKDGKNAFYDKSDPSLLSETGRYFIGGILHHINALCAFTASTVTSYKRLLPHNWASAFSCYGTDNREAAVRVISGQKSAEESGFNLEFKPTDGACNPYLAMAALLVAGMDGIRNRLEPGEPTLVDPLSLSLDERQRRGIHRLPEHLGEAAEALRNDPLFAGEMGTVLVDEYCKLKMFDWREYLRNVTSWEIDKYISAF